jgi:hypothetical protein
MMDINMLIRKVGLNNLSQIEFMIHGFRSMKMVSGMEITFKWIEETIGFMETQEIRRNMKQLNLPFAEANYDDEPLPDNVKYKLKRVETDYYKKHNGSISIIENEYTYLRDGRILTAYRSEVLD